MYLLRSKDEVSVKLQEYINCVRNKFGRTLKALRCDNGTEYTCQNTQAILKKEGIEFQPTVPYNPEQNGIAERKNRYLCESGRSMLFDANLPTKYWGEAVSTACYIQNRLPTKATEKTPYEMWNGTKPDLSHLRVFGSKAYVHIPKEKRTKWDARAEEGVCVGYSETPKAYRILHQATNKVTISRTVVFDEGCGSFSKSETVQTQNEQVDVGQSLQMPDQVTDVQEPYNRTDADVEIEVQETAPKEIAEDMEPPVRRSIRQNKGVPAVRLSYMARTVQQHEPDSWQQLQQLPAHEQAKRRQSGMHQAGKQRTNQRQNKTYRYQASPSSRSDRTQRHSVCLLRNKQNAGRCDDKTASETKARRTESGYGCCSC